MNTAPRTVIRRGRCVLRLLAAVSIAHSPRLSEPHYLSRFEPPEVPLELELEEFPRLPVDPVPVSELRSDEPAPWMRLPAVRAASLAMFPPARASIGIPADWATVRMCWACCWSLGSVIVAHCLIS